MKNHDDLKMSVDELLDEQSNSGLTATIEALPGDSKSVKVTPWLPSGSCLCENSIEIPKSAIASVRPTGEKHACCGKLLSVVEVNFEKTATLPVADVFASLVARAQHAAISLKQRGHTPPF
jgi:hypothetical protein